MTMITLILTTRVLREIVHVRRRPGERVHGHIVVTVVAIVIVGVVQILDAGGFERT
jgi:hypothetical protein